MSTLRSLGFGYNVNNLIAKTVTCCHYAFFYLIKLAIYIKLLNHYTKGTLKFLSDCSLFYFKSFHSFSRSLFHLSLTVLFTLSNIFAYLSFKGSSLFFIQIAIELLFLIWLVTKFTGLLPFTA